MTSRRDFFRSLAAGAVLAASSFYMPERWLNLPKTRESFDSLAIPSTIKEVFGPEFFRTFEQDSVFVKLIRDSERS